METSRFVAGVPVDVTTGQIPVQRLLCPNAGVMTGPGTNSYLIGHQELALVDPGPAMPVHTQAIMQALGGRPLKWIFVTHTHGDHSPGTPALQALTGAQLIGLAPHADAQYQDRSFVPDRLYGHDEQILCDGFSIRLIHTPGHVSNHLCFLLEEDGMLFTGDHILQGTTPVILPPDGNMSDYMKSLEDLRHLPLRALAPGHGEVMLEPEQMISTLIRHRQRRELKIVAALTTLKSCILDELVLLAYDDVPSHLLPWAKKTLLAHLYKLRDEGRARLLAPAPTSAGEKADIETSIWEVL
ncbi:MAG: MBL fold metallo-hydrolase [Pseudohongiella sp.]|nr:MBL fold metallo-hydrolase [Pseudohongiella sp.]